VIYVKDTRGILYSYKTVWYILRKKKKMKYGKPYIMNKKRPENAEEISKIKRFSYAKNRRFLSILKKDSMRQSQIRGTLS